MVRPTSTRASTRGSAVANRRRGAKADRDGDVSMDVGVKGRSKIGKTPPTGPAATRGKRNPAGTKNGLTSASAQRAILRQAASGDVSMREPKGPKGRLVELTVENYKNSSAAQTTDNGVSTLIDWLERKARMRLGRREVKITKSRVEGDVLIISVPSIEAKAYERMNNYEWAGAKLTIHRVGGPSKDKDSVSTTTEDTKAMLRGVLERRWNPDTKLLDLSALGQDPELQQQNMFAKSSTTSKFFPAMMRVLELSFSTVHERDEAITSVSLANNELSELKMVSTLSEALPNLINLDLSNNKIEKLASMGIWRRRFKKLQHLVISGNPLAQEPNVAQELVNWYPELRWFNDSQVRTEEAIKSRNNVSNIPFPIRAAHFEDLDGIAETFIRNWFTGFDNDRPSLAHAYYDELSEFSFALNTSALRDPTSSVKTEKQEWEAYIKGSRNFLKLSQLPARQSRAYKGTQSVLDVFAALPKTQHPDLGTESYKWMIEARMHPGLPDPVNKTPGGVDGFALIIHGEYHEPETGKQRSCSHVIYLGPSNNQFGVRVINHMMTVRAYGGYQAFQSSVSTPPLPAVSNDSLPQVPQLPQGLTAEVAEQMVAELSKQTNMTVNMSKDCLEQTGWNFDAALAAFQSVRATLPPSAFINGTA